MPTRLLVLASGSPRRRELLSRAGLEFEVRIADVDEEPRSGELPDALACRLALAKAEAVLATLEREAIVLAADTVVALDGRLLGKPADSDEAAAMLRQLSGRSHRVVTGFAVLGGGRRVDSVSTEVRFRALSDAMIARYVATGEPLDKAGGYGIQGVGASLVQGISGSYTNVVGLPLVEVLEALAEAGGPTR